MADPKAPAPPAKKGPSVGLALAAILMVALAAGVVLWQIPLAACPTCTSPGGQPAPIPSETARTATCPSCKTAGVTVDRFRDGTCPSCKAPAPKVDEPVRSGACVTCNGAGKISFVKKWGYDRIKVEVPKLDILK
jgi:hypothetical protein